MSVQLKDGFQGSRMIVLPSSVRASLEGEEFTSLLHVTDIGYYPHAGHHYRHRPSGSGEYILIYCTNGRGWIQLGEQRHILGPGTFFIIPPVVPHTYAADEADPWTIYWLHFSGKMAPHFGQGMDKVSEIRVSDDSRIARRIELFEELYRSLEIGCGRNQLNYACSILTCLLGSFKYMDDYRNSATKEDSDRNILERCRHYMLENIEKKMSVRDICDYIGHSPSYCTVMFDRLCGVSPMKYLQNLRIQTAVHLMDVSDMKINQICQKVGINDPYYFSRLFSRTMGMSPREYRRSTSMRRRQD